ncbi:hypothetical protein PG878_05850 [Xanthomonas hawaiiensis]|nr:hypothetical protein PG878_05850 [Xanthomonas sp. A6251]
MQIIAELEQTTRGAYTGAARDGWVHEAASAPSSAPAGHLPPKRGPWSRGEKGEAKAPLPPGEGLG